MSAAFKCGTCGKDFTVAPAVLARYPGWTPRACMACKGKKPAGDGAGSGAAKAKRPEATEPTDEELRTGIFTDGSCTPNPGPGGWGVVWVERDQIVREQRGAEAQSTNNRMELRAIIAALRLAPVDRPIVIWSDSELCVKTLTQWAASWEQRGWRRKEGEIKNLDLVQEAWALVRERPLVRLRWLRAHIGTRWNEYADQLARGR